MEEPHRAGDLPSHCVWGGMEISIHAWPPPGCRPLGHQDTFLQQFKLEPPEAPRHPRELAEVAGTWDD